MTDSEHRRHVLQALEKILASDLAKSVICDISQLGLVEMTRKRTRESLEHVLSEPCPACGGRGTVKTVETVCHEILREVMRSARQFDAREFLVLACSDVIEALLDEQSAGLAGLEAMISKPIKLQAEALYHQEHFDVVLI
jgi:ribonuclease G